MEVCTSAFDSFLMDSIVPLTIICSITAIAIIALNYMLGRMLDNAKMLEWSKTEVLQVVVSITTVALTLGMMQSFCAIDMKDIHSMFGVSGTEGSMFKAAEAYLVGAATYAHNAMTAVRYHLEGYTILSMLSAFICDLATGPIGWGCMFGYSGTNTSPLGSYNSILAALNLFYNSTLLSFFTAMNFLFILLYVKKGLVLFFLPFGIFLRSVPFMRSLGSLFMSVALGFLFIYPMTLAVFDMMGNKLLDRPSYIPSNYPSAYINEKVYPNNGGASGAGASAAAAFEGADYFEDLYFGSGDRTTEAIGFAAKAFIASTFMPTVAMLATIASIVFMARIYGEEIDLSRLLQMV